MIKKKKGRTVGGPKRGTFSGNDDKPRGKLTGNRYNSARGGQLRKERTWPRDFGLYPFQKKGAKLLTLDTGGGDAERRATAKRGFPGGITESGRTIRTKKVREKETIEQESRGSL